MTVVIGILTVMLLATELVLVADGAAAPFWVVALLPSTGALYIAIGLVAFDRRPSNRLGLLLVFGGVCYLLASLVNAGHTALVAIGLVMATAPLAVIVHAVLAFPSGHVDPAGAGLIVVAGYVVAVVLQSPTYLFTPEVAPFDVLAIAARPDLALFGQRLQRAAGSAVVVATAVVLVHRFVVAAPGQRRVLGPLYMYGVGAVLSLWIIANLIRPALGLDVAQTLVAQVVVLAGLPLAFVGALLLGGFARTGEITELATWIVGAERWATWPDALAETLGDPSLRLLFWLPERRAYADLDGTLVELPGPASRRAAVAIEAEGRPVGAIVYDPQLNPDRNVVVAAGGIIAVALDRDRLTAELREERLSLQDSQARLVEAGEQERRRIARDLHDGIQANLLVHALNACQLAVDPSASASTARQARQLQAGLERTARELRRLVHGMMPALLIERGLHAAIEDLVDTIPIRTELAISGVDLPMPASVESAAYFVIAEAIANAVKHSAATALAVHITRTDGVLRVVVDDDGVGGAVVTGSGLRGIVDRVHVLGGRVDVVSAAGSGTCLRAELPCGS